VTSTPVRHRLCKCGVSLTLHGCCTNGGWQDNDTALSRCAHNCSRQYQLVMLHCSLAALSVHATLIAFSMLIMQLGVMQAATPAVISLLWQLLCGAGPIQTRCHWQQLRKLCYTVAVCASWKLSLCLSVAQLSAGTALQVLSRYLGIAGGVG
jgi:hypothetical protein